jgi:DNA modification methylase
MREMRMSNVNIHTGNCLDILPTMEAGSVNCCVTSPPYFGLRDYGNDEQIGLEETPEAFVESLVKVFREVKRVLADDGTLWLNLGDSYAATGGHTGYGASSMLRSEAQKDARNFKSQKVPSGLKPKDLIGIPWRVAFALQQDGWYLRQDIIWSKPNPMPESVTDRCTKAHEYIFLLSKKAKYFYDAEAVKEICVEPVREREKNNGESSVETKLRGHSGMCGTGETRNKRSVWEVTTKPYSGAHFATFPPDLIKPCILAGCPAGGTVLDPFGGSGTTGMVALELGRSAELIELNPDYVGIIEGRTNVTPGFNFEGGAS